jgi:hypothetical protein
MSEGQRTMLTLDGIKPVIGELRSDACARLFPLRPSVALSTRHA